MNREEFIVEKGKRYRVLYDEAGRAYSKALAQDVPSLGSMDPQELRLQRIEEMLNEVLKLLRGKS